MDDPSLRRGTGTAVTPAAHADEPTAHAPRGSLAALVIGALGVVYGDIARIMQRVDRYAGQNVAVA
jgi:hypothetical protein